MRWTLLGGVGQESYGVCCFPTIKMALVAEEVCRGDRHEQGLGEEGKELNPFQWASIRLNLPGSEGYNPCKSWVSKLQANGWVACNLFTFVDDKRVTGADEDLAWQASHMLASKQSYLGIQDAARKARPSSKTPGAWAGALVHVLTLLGVCVLTSVEKWNKMKGILDKWWNRVSGGIGEKLSHKELMMDRGFLVYLTRTYPAMVPYLKGFHLTIETWRGGYDIKGWKVQDNASAGSSASLDSLDITKAGMRGRDLSLVDQVDDEGVADAAHRVPLKTGNGQ